MAKKKKNKGGGVKKLIRQAGPNISKKELKKITKATGGNVAKALNKISAVQKSMKSAGKTAPSVSSGAANMLIKQQQKGPFAFGRSGLGDSKIAQAIRQMAGTPDFRSAQMRQRGLGPGATPGTGMMIGGTVIRPGGKVAVKKRRMGTAAPAAETPPAETQPTEPVDTGDTFDPYSMFGDMMDMMPDYGSMIGDLQSQMENMFEDLSSQFDTPDPIQLFNMGKAYGGDLIRARQRQRKTRADYLRNQLSNMAIGSQALAPMAFGGGVTI